MTEWSDMYGDAFVLEDDVAVAEVAAAGRLVERLGRSSLGIQVLLTDGTVLHFKSEGILRVEVEHGDT